MSITVSTVCPGCNSGLEFAAGLSRTVCGSCGAALRVLPGETAPAMYVPAALDAPGAAEAAKDSLASSGTAYASVREATLFHLPFCLRTSRKVHWGVHDIVRKPDGSKSMELRPLLGYGEDVLSGLLMGGGADASERKLDLAVDDTASITPMLSLDGVKLKIPVPSVLSPLPSHLPGFPVSPDSECTQAAAKDVPNIEATVSARSMTVYMPFWVVETARADRSGGSLVVIDGAGGAVIAPDAPLSLLDRLLKISKPDTAAVPLSPDKCPDCGGGLVGGELDAAVFCTSCRKAFGPDGGIPYTVMPPPANVQGELVHLPVWAVEARLVSPERVVDTRFELFRLAPGKGWPKDDDKRIPMRFFMPAFRMENMKAFTRAAADMTRSQPLIPDTADGVAASARGCLFGPGDAMRLSTLLLYPLVPKGNKVSVAYALNADVEPVAARLLLVPFVKTKYDYRDAATGVSIPVSALGK